MSNIMAAIGIEQLKRFPDFAVTRKQLAKRYCANLESNDSIELLKHDWDSIVPHIFVIKLRMGHRDEIKDELLKYGIQAGVHYLPNHFLSLYKPNITLPLPVTEEIYPKLLTLPLHPDLDEVDIDYICECLAKCVEEINERSNS